MAKSSQNETLALDPIEVDLLAYVVEAFVEDNHGNKTNLPPETARAAAKLLKRFKQFEDTANRCAALGPQCRSCKDFHGCRLRKGAHKKHVGICKHQPVTWTGDHSDAYATVFTKVVSEVATARKAG